MTTYNPHTYPTYKASGVEWLGEMPEHWEVLPGRACFREKSKEPNLGLLEKTVLSLSYGHIVVKPPEKLHGLVPSSFETYQIVDPLDIVVRPTDLQNDWNSLRFGLSKHRGIITSAYMCLRTNRRLLDQYGFLLLHAYDLMKIFYGLGSGLRQNLSWADFRYLPCCVPPFLEQKAIVSFLDHAVRRIRRYIHAKERLIELLEEQKQAIIHQAVTGQIDVRTGKPYPAYKNSGVEWLGKVPEHWEVRRFRTLGSGFTNGSTARQMERGVSDHRVSRIETISTGRVDFRRVGYLENITGIESYSLKPNDFLISHINSFDKVGNSARYGGQHPLVHGMNLIRVTPRNVVPKYLEYLLKTPLFFGSMRRACKPAINQVSVTTIAIKAIHFPLPEFQVQHEIIEYLDKETNGIENAKRRHHQLIEFLREYRTRLIADVVTGKLDVRQAAANLPDEAETPEPLDAVEK